MPLLNATPPVAGAPVVVPNNGIATIEWYNYLSRLATAINAANAVINTIPGVNVFTVATQPALALADAGYIGLVTDTNHLVRWTGVVWEFMGGDEPGKLEDFAAAPSAAAYALCDGTGTTLLAVGAVLALTAFTTPNLSGTPAFKRSGAAYTGVIGAASAPGISGATGATAPGTDTQGSHSHTGATGSHTHTFTTGAGDTSSPPAGTVAAGTNVSLATHVHTGTTDGSTASISADGSHSHTVDSHTHPVGTLAVDATALPARLSVLPYVRR